MLEGILSLTATGIGLEDIYDLPLDVFNLYVDMASRLESNRRSAFAIDTASAISGAFSAGSHLKEHVEALQAHYSGD